MTGLGSTLGPCQTSAHTRIGTDQNDEFKTVPAAHYPGPLCAFLAKAGGQAPLEKPSPSSGNPSYVAGMEEISQSDATTVFLPGELDFVFEDVAEVSNRSMEVDKVTIKSGCQGPPLRAKYAGRCEDFCAGMGLCSPGRWHPGLAKTVEQVAYCDKLADLIDKFCLRKLSDLPQATLQLTLGRFQTSPFSEEDMEKLRQEWFKLLPDPGKAQVVPPDQPFLLHALAQSLRLMGDPDVEAIDGEGGSNFVDGVHLGHIHRFGPTLHHRSSGFG